MPVQSVSERIKNKVENPHILTPCPWKKKTNEIICASNFSLKKQNDPYFKLWDISLSYLQAGTDHARFPVRKWNN